MLHDNYVARFGLTKTAEVGLLLGYNEKTIRLWRKNFIINKGEFSEYRQGKYTHLDNEEYRDKALEWVRSNACLKGTLNMTVKRFCDWVNEHLYQTLSHKFHARFQHVQQHGGYIRLDSSHRHHTKVCTWMDTSEKSTGSFTLGSWRSSKRPMHHHPLAVTSRLHRTSLRKKNTFDAVT